MMPGDWLTAAAPSSNSHPAGLRHAFANKLTWLDYPRHMTSHKIIGIKRSVLR